MRGALKLLTAATAALLVASCGGGGGGGSGSGGVTSGSSVTTKTGTAYAYDSALTGGIFGIRAVVASAGEEIRSGAGNYTFPLVNGTATLKIKENFASDFIDETSAVPERIEFVRLCADGVDSARNVYLGAEPAFETEEFAEETGVFATIRDDALCVMISYEDFDISEESYFANPYTDFVDYLYNYAMFSTNEIVNIAQKVNNNLGITYKDTARDASDAESYVNELKNAFNITYGKDWEWKAQIFKAFADAEPTFTETAAEFFAIFVKPQRINAPMAEQPLDTCVVTYWDNSTNQFATSATSCIKLDDNYAVEINSEGDLYGLLVKTGRTDSDGNPTYYEVAYHGGYDYSALSLISYAYGIPQIVRDGARVLNYHCYDPNAKKIVEVGTPSVVGCYIDDDSKEIVCQFKAAISTTPSDEQGNYFNCTASLLNATMDGETVYAQGYLKLSKEKERQSYYGNDVFATLYDAVFEE